MRMRNAKFLQHAKYIAIIRIASHIHAIYIGYSNPMYIAF